MLFRGLLGLLDVLGRLVKDTGDGVGYATAVDTQRRGPRELDASSRPCATPPKDCYYAVRASYRFQGALNLETADRTDPSRMRRELEIDH